MSPSSPTAPPDPQFVAELKALLAPFNPKYDVVLFHGPCVDGGTAAWTYWHQLPEGYRAMLHKTGGYYSGERAIGERNVLSTSTAGAIRLLKQGYPLVFASVIPAPIPLELVAGRRVVTLDICPTNLMEILEVATSVKVVDHHISAEPLVKLAQEKYPNKFSSRFVTAKTDSGASLAWKEFEGPDAPIPLLVTCVQIGDTWNFEQRPDLQVKAVNEALYSSGCFDSFEGTEKHFQEWSQQGDAFYHKLVESGNYIRMYQQLLVESIARKSCLLYAVANEQGQQRVYNVLTVCSGTLNSEVGNVMRTHVAPVYEAKGTRIDFTVVWSYDPHDRMIRISFRGAGEGIDLSQVAKQLVGEGFQPGGGHRAASGAVIKGIENFHKVFLHSPPQLEQPQAQQAQQPR